MHVPPSALSAAMGWADWPARLQQLGAGPARRRSREVWLDGGHNPSAARQIAAFAEHHFDDGKPLHLVFASLATKDPAGMLEPFADIARTRARRADPRPRMLRARRPREIARISASRPKRTTASKTRWRDSAGRARADLRFALSRRAASSQRTIRCRTRLVRRFASTLRRQSVLLGAPSLGGDAHPFEEHEQYRESPGGRGPAEHGRIAICVERSRPRCRGPASRSGKSATTATHIGPR